jgi:hypothetical protein
MPPRKKKPSAAPRPAAERAGARRSYLSQSDVPGCALDEALRVPRALAENYAAKATPPLHVAAALEMQPNAGRFRLLTGAAIAYGVTAGGPNAPEIAVTPLGMRIVRPLKEGDDLAARREALLRPRVVGEFLQKYNGAPLPRADIAVNVLTEMGVPRERADEVLDFILQGAASVGVLKEIKDKKYIDLSGVPLAEVAAAREDARQAEEDAAGGSGTAGGPPERLPERPASAAAGGQAAGPEARRVFVTHGKNKALVDPIKRLLAFGELEAVVSVEKSSVSQPVPDKVMADMRGCGAAIVHVDAEQRLRDGDGAEQVVVNPNVLIEIGAAMALYGRRVVLLVREGVKLPSNLQGLYEVRYAGETLDGDATIRLLGAINDVKNHPVPDRYRS